MATIRKRGDKWQVRIQLTGFEEVSKSFMLRSDAEAWGKLTEAEMIRGVFIKRTDAERTTLSDALDRYEREVTPGKRGADIEKVRITKWKRHKLAKKTMALIRPADFASYRDTRTKEGAAPATVRLELALVSNLFNVARKEWGFDGLPNPIAAIRLPTVKNARDRVLTDCERTALLAACGTCQSPWIKPVVEFALSTGARRGEILSLRWADVDLARSTARVDGKTGPRHIPLSSTCKGLLNSLPRSLNGFVFPVTKETLQQAYSRAVARAGVKDFVFHDLRHDALTQLARRGLSVLELRAISGHATATMLQRYVNIDASELAAKLA